jgi:hypothetical protein
LSAEAAHGDDPRLSRALAGVAVLLILGAAVVGSVQVIRERGARAGANSRLDFADREIAWGNGWMLSQSALYAARSLIPEDADYTVEKGGEAQFEDPLTYRFAEGYLRYWLMPRRQRGGAAWVICMRCERDELGDDATVVWEDVDAGVAIVERRRGAS